MNTSKDKLLEQLEEHNTQALEDLTDIQEDQQEIVDAPSKAHNEINKEPE